MRFADAPELFDNGWTTVVPAHGKACGKGWNRWQAETPPRHLIEAWANVRAAENVALIMDGTIVAVDLDHDDAERAFAIREIADEHLGQTDLWRTRKPGHRTLRLYRPADESIATQHFHGVDISVYCTTGLIILGGKHPNGNEYTWPETSPLDCGPDDLPLVDQTRVLGFIEAVTSAFPPPEGVTPHGNGFRASTPHGVNADDVFAHFMAGHDRFISLPAAASDFIQRSTQLHPAMAAAVWTLANYGYSEAAITGFLREAVTTHPRAISTSPTNRERELERSARGAVARMGG